MTQPDAPQIADPTECGVCHVRLSMENWDRIYVRKNDGAVMCEQDAIVDTVLARFDRVSGG